MFKKRRGLCAIVLSGLVLALGGTSIAYTQNDDRPPSKGQIAFAQQVSDLLLNELLAALFQEFNETTPQNVEHGKQAISLIFNDANRDIRLVGAFGPLQGGANDRPADRFETRALKSALSGEASSDVQQ